MKIKYLLSGRLIADLTHFRRFTDFWPRNIPFPQVISNYKDLKDNDLVICCGYLGESAKLIKNHNPKNVFIFDNSIYPTKVFKHFRILDGNLKNFSKEDSCISNVIKDYYQKSINKDIEELRFNQIKNENNEELKRNLPLNNFTFLLPWSLPLKVLINKKNKYEIINFEKNVKGKKQYEIYKMAKRDNIVCLTNKHIPLIRKPNFKRNKFSLNDCFNRCKDIICPSSTLLLKGIIVKKDIYYSKYNPLSEYINEYPEYKSFNDKLIKSTLSDYLGKISFDINDFYKYLIG